MSRKKCHEVIVFTATDGLMFNLKLQYNHRLRYIGWALFTLIFILPCMQNTVVAGQRNSIVAEAIAVLEKPDSIMINRTNAVEIVRQAAHDGDGKAAAVLGRLHVTGIAVEPDLKLARHWLEVAIRSQQATAFFDLSLLLNDPASDAYNPEQAGQHFETALTMQEPRACYVAAGRALEIGQTKNVAQFLKCSAKGGYGPGAVSYVDYEQMITGGSASEEARRYLKFAATRGFAEASTKLATLN